MRQTTRLRDRLSRQLQTCMLRMDAGYNGMLPPSATLCATGGIPDALLSRRSVQSNFAT
jgi:hypothetical protein